MEIINPSICNPNIKIFSSSKPESEKKKNSNNFTQIIGTLN